MVEKLNEAGETWDDDYGLDPKATTTNQPTRLEARELAEIAERAEKAIEGLTTLLSNEELPRIAELEAKLKESTMPIVDGVPRLFTQCPDCGHDFKNTNEITRAALYDCRVRPYASQGDPTICGCDNDFHSTNRGE